MVARFEIASDNDATTWEDITSLVNWEGAQFGGTAEHGQIDTGSGFDLRDDAGTRVLPKRRRVRLIETATTPDTTMWQGRTVAANLARGVIRTASAKVFDVSLVDTNADFGGIAFAQTPRPAETDFERWQFFLDTYVGSTLALGDRTRPSTGIDETPYFSGSTATPVELPAHMYSGVQLGEVAAHISEGSGRQYFLTNLYELWYDVTGATTYPAGISITDVSPDFTTSFPPGQPSANEDGTELFTAVRYRYSDNRVVQVTRTAAEDANDQWRTSIVDESVTTLARATARANKFLDEFDHEQTVFSCWVDLPATMVDQLSWGMTISFRSAACGIFTPTTYRVSRCSWEMVGQGLWRAHLELNYPNKFHRRSNPGTPPATAPLPFVPGTGQVQVVTKDEQVSADLTIASGDGWATPGAGNLLVMWHSARSGKTPLTPSGWTAHPQGTVVANNDRGGMFYKIAAGTESSITASVSAGDRHACTIAEYAGTWTVDDDAEATGTGTALASGSVTPPTGERTLIVGGVTSNTSDVQASVTPGAGWTELGDQMVDGPPVLGSGFHPLHWMAAQIVSSASGSYNPSGTATSSGDWGGQTLSFTTEDDPTGHPVQGQEIVEPAFDSDGTTTTGSPTTYPYAPSSLRITVNGVQVPVTETDPEAGTYAFATAPPTGADVVVRYISTGLVF